MSSICITGFASSLWLATSLWLAISITCCPFGLLPLSCCLWLASSVVNIDTDNLLLFCACLCQDISYLFAYWTCQVFLHDHVSVCVRHALTWWAHTKGGSYCSHLKHKGHIWLQGCHATISELCTLHCRFDLLQKIVCWIVVGRHFTMSVVLVI